MSVCSLPTALGTRKEERKNSHTRHARRGRHTGPPTQPFLRLAHRALLTFPLVPAVVPDRTSPTTTPCLHLFFPAVLTKGDPRLTHPLCALSYANTPSTLLLAPCRSNGDVVVCVPAAPCPEIEERTGPAGLSAYTMDILTLSGSHLHRSIHRAMHVRALQSPL